MDSPHEQIRNLLGSYCERMDAGDFQGLADLFADATLADEHGNVFATGSDEVRAMWEAQTHFPLQPIVSGRYTDTFACDETGRWHWAQRRYAIDPAGDLSHHLRTS